MQTHRWKFPLIAFIVAGFLLALWQFDLTLGIDLKGGSVLIYDLDLRDIKPVDRHPDKVTKPTIEILSRRLDSLGMKEMSIRQAGDYQLMVQLPGVSEQSKEQIKDTIRRAGQLWFKIVADPGSYDPGVIKDVQEQKARGEYNPDENEYDIAQYRDPARGTEPLVLLNEGAVDGRKLDGADPDVDPKWGGPAVRFVMKREGRGKLADTSSKNVNKRMAIVLDGVVETDPQINEPLVEGTAIITGKFTPQQVETLVTVLRSGALPAKPILTSENTVEATLGQESIKRGFWAMIGSVTVVAIFMFVYYFGAGAVANFALILNIIVLLGVMTLFEATLTLPGIAGIVLTVGMAVDANILIYERIREEKRRGVSIREAVDAGYNNAFWAIFDSNITTILTAAILYYVGTGPIKGFAVTLVIGIAVSMFTALFVTRALFEYLTEKGIVTELRMLKLTEMVPTFPFIAKRKPFMMVGILLLNAGFVWFVMRGPEKYGIDFNGGSALQVRLTQPLPKTEVEKRLERIERPGPDGAPTRPYADAEVTKVVEPAGKETAAAMYQILISSHGRKEAPVAVTGTAEGEAQRKTPQDLFIEAVEEAFRAELVPPAFTERSVDTSGGRTTLSLRVNLARGATIDPAQAQSALTEAGIAEPTVAAVGPQALSVTAQVSLQQVESSETALKSVFEEKYGAQLSNPFPYKTSIGPSVADTLKYRAVLAIILSLLMIVVYVAFRFEFKMGVAATLCLFHDVLITLGFMQLLDVTSPWTGIDAKQNLTTIAAYLTIVGFSINDTIVTFDRMRENLAKWTPGHGEWKTYEEVLNASINQTLGRTILTSTTVFLTLLVLAVAGVKSIQGFTLAMLIGVIFGTFSTIFIATPILLVQPRKLAMFVLGELGLFIGAIIVSGLIR